MDEITVCDYCLKPLVELKLYEMCRSTITTASKFTPTMQFICTRPKGHAGDHAACSSYSLRSANHPAYRWENKDG